MFPIEELQITLGKLVPVLVRHGVRFHLTGGITSVAYSETRLTQEVDLVLDNQAVSDNLDSLCSEWKEAGFLLEREAIRAAVRCKGMFQLFHNNEALKVDLYVRELIPGELSRSVEVEVFEGVSLPIASRADVAASKLIWISKGSHKSRRDVRHMLRTASAAERATVDALAHDLNLTDLLAEVLREPDELVE
ncbi:MAG: nucleotidyl transferase AbiEii/AbiGii toxin family protein [Planctomycetales bacterium]|nr:nucleotidyl transferase AbiEii/AbiGii toxin family protein [Planctomycetales bacterium]